MEEDFDEEDEVGEDNGRNKAPKKQLVSTIADSTRNAPCRPSPLISLRVTSNVAIRERTKLKIQCPLDIQTTLRHQGRGRYRQRGRFIKRLDIATWRPL